MPTCYAQSAYTKSDDGEHIVTIDGEYVPNEAIVSVVGEYVPSDDMGRAGTDCHAARHGTARWPPRVTDRRSAPPLQRIVQDGARLRARLPAYLAQRRALLDAHCSLLPPLQALV
jgi:hypothetical protein